MKKSINQHYWESEVAKSIFIANNGRGDINLRDVAHPMLHVTYADNEGLILLNGSQIFHERTESNPDLRWKRDLTTDLVAGRNVLDLIAANRNGPAHFLATITDGDGGPEVMRFQGDVNYPDEPWGIFYWGSLVIWK